MDVARTTKQRAGWDLERVRKREEHLVKSVKYIDSAIAELNKTVKTGLYIGSKDWLHSQLFTLYAFAREVSDILKEYKFWEAEQAARLAEKIAELARQLSKNIKGRDRFTDEDGRLVYSITRNYNFLLSYLEQIPFHYVTAKDFYPSLKTGSPS